MTWKDKLEIGLKEDAPYRKDNLPASEIRGPEKPAGPGRSPENSDGACSQDATVDAGSHSYDSAQAWPHVPRTERSSETQAQDCLNGHWRSKA